jgi:ketosteroid isomerase-like protein
MATGDIDNLLALEKRRCEAIAAGDAETLTAMLAEDYIHIHLNGFEDTRTGHVQRVVKSPRRFERGEVKVRVFGDVAVLNGSGTNFMTHPKTGADIIIPVTVQQVAVRRANGWIYVLTQMTRLLDPTKPDPLADLFAKR